MELESLPQGKPSRDMVRIALRGRTGNNMFQYALGRALSERHGVPLLLDASWFNEEGWAEVSHFLKLPLKAKVVRQFSLASRALRKFTEKHHWEYRSFPILKEPLDNHTFDRKFLNASPDCMLSGFFQSPLYFQSIAFSLRTELNKLLSETVCLPPEVSEDLGNSSSVAVHVRRQDYLYHPNLQVCDQQYYERAMGQMRKIVSDTKFYIFSDDPEWCRSKFTGEDTVIIDSGPTTSGPLHDLFLMSQTSHHIIANSSYSWWAAWLGKKEHQQVILPERWFVKNIKAPIKEKMEEGWTVVGK